MNDSEVVVDAAVEADVDRIAGLYVEAFPDKFGPILGEDAEHLLQLVFNAAPRSFIRDMFVARVDGEAAGFLRLGLSLTSYLEESRYYFSVLRRQLGPRRALSRLLKTTVLEVTPPDVRDEEYIKAIGVGSGHRGKGLGSKLIDRAECEAKERGKRVLSLHVLADNPGAIRLYRRLGFELGPEQRSRMLAWAVKRAGYHKMVKVLD